MYIIIINIPCVLRLWCITVLDILQWRNPICSRDGELWKTYTPVFVNHVCILIFTHKSYAYSTKWAYNVRTRIFHVNITRFFFYFYLHNYSNMYKYEIYYFSHVCLSVTICQKQKNKKNLKRKREWFAATGLSAHGSNPAVRKFGIQAYNCYDVGIR